jgi:spermidine synthase
MFCPIPISDIMPSTLKAGKDVLDGGIRMELWFTEEWLKGLRISVKVNSVVYSTVTKYQRLAIYDTVQFGRMLVLDDVIQTTESDEHIYHESLAHVPMFAHPNPERVLVIGGGDGGTLREVLKHPSVKEATLVDIDGGVIEASKRFMPLWNSGFSDPRADVIVGDGLEYVAKATADFDVILVDATDPVGPGEVLFAGEFYGSVKKALRPGGIMAGQTESPIAEPNVVKSIYDRVKKVFPITRLYTSPVPSYPGGWWSYTIASIGSEPMVPLREPGDDWGLKYYSPEIHKRAFFLNPKMQKDIGIHNQGTDS